MTYTTTDLIEQLAGMGYEPTDGQPDLLPRIKSTVDYYQGHWDVFRDNGDSITFATTSEDGHRIMTTTDNGVIMAEASFTDGRVGSRMFIECAGMRP